MNHLSFYWLPDNQQLFIESLETEFAELVEQSINTGKNIPSSNFRSCSQDSKNCAP